MRLRNFSGFLLRRSEIRNRPGLPESVTNIMLRTVQDECGTRTRIVRVSHFGVHFHSTFSVHSLVHIFMFSGIFFGQTLLKKFQSRSWGVSKPANSWIIIQQLDIYLTTNHFLRRDGPGVCTRVWLKNSRQGTRGRLKKNFRRSIGIFFAKRGSGFVLQKVVTSYPNFS